MSIRRDYKPTANRLRRRQTARRNGLLVMTLVLIGLFGGLLAYIKGDRNQQPAPVTAVPPAPAVKPAPPKVAAPEPAPESAPARPKYDFYTELPKRQVEIVPEAPASRPAPTSRPQPAHEPLRKPAVPAAPGNTPAPTVATTANQPKPAVRSGD